MKQFKSKVTGEISQTLQQEPEYVQGIWGYAVTIVTGNEKGLRLILPEQKLDMFEEVTQ